MAYKINKITITNFKAFVGEPFVLDLNGKNLLLYGENGSGKSSIYWSIYTMLQSCLKKQNATDAGKYFDPANPENLRNRYSEAIDPSSIIMEFIDNANGRTFSYTDSMNLINTAVPRDMFMFDTLAPSDFINYKFLFSVFNFRNSQDADIFEIFERDIFPTMEFSESLHDVNDVDKMTLNAHDWWKYLTEDALGQLDKYQNGKYKPVGAKYSKHKEYLDKFNEQLTKQVKLIVHNTNALLKPDGGFPLPLKIELRVEPLKFNQQIRRGGKRRDEKITKPQIILTAELTDPAISAPNRYLRHPHTFLNEAKMARIALAMRFAIVNMKNDGLLARGAQLLCIDDMLISLDMSNRLEVIDYLLDAYSSDYQIIFMTHDRALYRIMENKIRSKHADFWWLKKELYCVDPDISKTHHPSSQLLDEQDLLSCAIYYLDKHDYPVCANTLRRLLEQLLHELLPENMQKTKSGEIMELSSMLDQMSSFFTKYKLANLLPNLDIYREHILNPLSHDDLRSNIYREELKRCITDVAELTKYTRHIIVTCKEAPELFKMEIAGQTVVFEVREVWDYVLDPDGKKYYKPIVVVVKQSTINGISPNSERKIDAMYRRMCEKIGLADTARPEMLSTIFHVADGACLTSY